jgi:guanidinoacetate N-methyltransferase
MIKRIKRGGGYELVLEISDDNFINPPRADQRNWLLNRWMKESSQELVHLDAMTQSFIKGGGKGVDFDRAQAELDDKNIMEDWQIPVMQQMASAVATGGGDVLEIGMGRGIASSFIQDHNPRSHTLVECNEFIVSQFDQWKAAYPGRDITMMPGMWQDRVPDMATYDGLLFHTYPLSEQDFVEQVVQGVTFAEHFFETASKLLNPGGIFTYLSNETDSFSRAHQRALFNHFSEVTLSLIKDLNIPDDTEDALWYPQLVMVKVKR